MEGVSDWYDERFQYAFSDAARDPAELKTYVCPKIKGDDGSLERAVESKDEIMISCNTILAIHPRFYYEMVLNKLRYDNL